MNDQCSELLFTGDITLFDITYNRNNSTVRQKIEKDILLKENEQEVMLQMQHLRKKTNQASKGVYCSLIYLMTYSNDVAKITDLIRRRKALTSSSIQSQFE